MDFKTSDTIPAPVADVFSAWLDSDGHSKMTGAASIAAAEVGDEFEAWGGYIMGRNMEITTNQRIVQSWRTVEFTDQEADSRLEIVLRADGESTIVDIHHSNLPEHGMQYLQGWADHYFTPMKEFFGQER